MASVLIDSYDPAEELPADVFGHREDPATEFAYREMYCEYEGSVGETLSFRLFSPDRLRGAAIGTGWTVVELGPNPPDDRVQYRAALTEEKRFGFDGVTLRLEDDEKLPGVPGLAAFDRSAVAPSLDRDRCTRGRATSPATDFRSPTTSRCRRSLRPSIRTRVWPSRYPRPPSRSGRCPPNRTPSHREPHPLTPAESSTDPPLFLPSGR